MNNRMHLFVLIIFLLIIPFKLNGYELNGHRPYFTIPARTIGYETFLMEFGYTFTKTDDEREHTIGEMLFRIGILSFLETLFGGTYKVEDKPNDFDTRVDDGYIGLKLRLFKSPNYFAMFNPDISILAGTLILAKDTDSGGYAAQPEGRLLFSWPILKSIRLENNLNYTYVSEDDERFNQVSYSFITKFMLGSYISTFAEYYSFLPETKDGKNGYYIKAGFTISLFKKSRVDLHVGRNIKGNFDRYFAGIGFIYELDIL